MDTHQPRPVTPQPPHGGGGGGGGGGFSAILTVFLSFIAILAMVLYIKLHISTLNTIYQYSTAAAFFVLHRLLQYYHIPSLISIAFALASDRSHYLFYYVFEIYFSMILISVFIYLLRLDF